MSSPFIYYRHKLESYSAAIDAGMTDEQFVTLVTELDRRVAEIDGTGFRQTPFVELSTPMDRTVMAKVETGNVGRSHKARHLFGLMLHAEVKARLGDGSKPRLAIASCGNAALGAAIVARAAARELDVFVPIDADPLVINKLQAHGANIVICERSPGVAGDPCMHRLEEALVNGAEAFTVQGTKCPDAFDGARTIGFELAEQLHAANVQPTDLYIQVGGGAFATAVIDGLQLADFSPMPRLHPVQPAQAHPYVAAWQRLAPVLLEAVGRDTNTPLTSAVLEELAEAAREHKLDSVLAANADAMTPWPTMPESVATGILDDVTYDWLPLVKHQLATAGWPILPTEDDLRAATKLAAGQVVPPPDATGAAGLAGALVDPGPPASESLEPDLHPGPAVVILSGIDREWEETTGLAAST